MQKGHFSSRFVRLFCCAVVTAALCGCGNDNPSAANAAMTQATSQGSDATPAASNTLIPATDTGNTNAAGSGTSGSSNTVSSADGVKLAWERPAINTDGTTASNLAGYEIHYGTTSMQYNGTIQIPGATNTGYTIANLSPDTYYFAVTTYDSAGNESALSQEISATVN
jgi:hypothetical protein